MLLPPLCTAGVGVSLFDGKHFTPQVLIAVFKFCCYVSTPGSLSDFLLLSAVIRARDITYVAPVREGLRNAPEPHLISSVASERRACEAWRESR